MQAIIQIITGVVTVAITALQLLIMIRAITSWFPIDEESAFMNFLYFMTEPLLAPLRAILERIPLLRDLPIDASSLVAMILLMLIGAFLPEIHF